MNSYNIYKPLNLTRPSVPSQSYLYQLSPIGIGTPFVESLSSFITRLAEAHCVATGILMTRVIAPKINKYYITKGLSKGLSELLNRGSTLNSTGRMGRELIISLQDLTHRDDLKYLTLQTFDKIFPSQGLLRKYKAWCSQCYKQWHSSGQLSHEPLLWVIESVKICPIHHCPLGLFCLNCQKQIPWLAWNSRIGYCSDCNHLLCNSEQQFLAETGFPSGENLKGQIWTANTVRELIAQIPNFPVPLPKETLANSIQVIVNTTHQGNIAAFARSLNFPKNTVWMWYQGKALPRLDVLLEICRGLQLSLMNLLTLDTETAKSLSLHPQELPQPTPKQRQARKPFDVNRVQAALQEIILSDEQPPPNLQEVANSLGHDRRIIFGYFPLLCKTISAKHRLYVEAVRERTILECCQQIREIAIQLHKEGQYPSEVRVSNRLSKPGYFRYKEVRSTLKQIRQELGLKK